MRFRVAFGGVAGLFAIMDVTGAGNWASNRLSFGELAATEILEAMKG